ncbi:MAG: oxidoreductase [Deltaproteobacteria bacterium]|nr:MAG: oxidoreductase [Deltaproteobacteria bacterium]
MSALSFGIIGVGHLGAIHAKVASQMTSLDLVGVYDTDLARAQKVAEQVGVPAMTTLEELLEQVDAVSIVVPTVHHFEVAKKALDYGCHIFLEKPITATVDEARTIVRLAKEAGKKLQVGHIERFNPAVLALEQYDLQPMFIESHRLSPFHPRGTDVSVVLDLMIHDLDIILALVNRPLQAVDASGVAVVSESEDIASVRLTFDNGAVANITTSRISVKAMRKMRIFQKDMYVAIDFLQKQSEVFQLAGRDSTGGQGMPVATIGEGERARQVVYEQPEVPAVNSMELELDRFAQAIDKGEHTPVTGEDGLRALDVAETILRKIQSQ